MVRTPERRLRGHASFVLPHTESSSATSGVHISSPTIPQSAADARIRNSELSDLHLEPTFVVPAAITVVHPQLRDLISCPKERGVLYHVKGTSIVELTVDIHNDEGGDDNRSCDDNKRSGSGSRSPMSREWWCPSYHSRQVSSLGFIPNCLTTSMDMLACGGQQGELHLTTLPPPASEGWGRSESTMQRESGGWRNRSTQSHDPSSSASWSMTATLPHASINNSFVLLPPYSGDTPLPTRPGSPIEETTNQGSVYQGARDGAGVSAPVATFPNSLPRGSRVRRYSTREYHLDDARRPSAFSNRSEDLTDDSRRSSDGSPAGGDDGISFLNTLMHASSSANPMDPPPYTLTTSPDEFMPRDPSSTRPRINRAFRGRTHSDGNRTAAGNSPMTFDRRRSSNMSNSIEPDIYVHASGMATFGSQTAVGSTQPYTRHPPPSWYSHLMIDSQFPQRRHPSGPISLPLSAPRGDPRLLVSNNDHFVKLFALRAPRPGAMDRDGTRESDAKFGTRRLTNVGGVKINTAANHSSLSPDGKTMICVGDNHELYLYEVISGGVDFRLIRTYRASDDAGFSTSWSKDGKKFAVASQDGVVTVWDHRSSDPLAKLFTRTRHDFGRFDYEDSYYWRSASSDGSRRDPARVVKFSPPGSSRDLLVFSEEGEAIHIVDARTFDVQSRVELPIVSREERIRNAHHSSYSPTRRMGPDGGRVGIAGIAFDPTGDFLYAGTEAVMVEYDLRRHARRGLGSWVLA